MRLYYDIPRLLCLYDARGLILIPLHWVWSWFCCFLYNYVARSQLETHLISEKIEVLVKD